jgi:hypothetical protein
VNVFLQRGPAVDAAKIEIRFDLNRFVGRDDSELRMPQVRLLLYDQQTALS